MHNCLTALQQMCAGPFLFSSTALRVVLPGPDSLPNCSKSWQSRGTAGPHQSKPSGTALWVMHPLQVIWPGKVRRCRQGGGSQLATRSPKRGLQLESDCQLPRTCEMTSCWQPPRENDGDVEPGLRWHLLQHGWCCRFSAQTPCSQAPVMENL